MQNYFSEAFKTPWKMQNEIWRLLISPSVNLQFMLAGLKRGKNWSFYGTPILQVYYGSKVTIGDNLSLRSNFKSNPLSPNHPVVISTRNPRAVIRIGDSFGMTGGSIVAEESIVIGDRVLVGANSLIIDSDFHSLDSQDRNVRINKAMTSPVVIEDDVFIGTQVIVLKGSHIGVRSVIGAGSVVVGNIPSDVLAAGNPAKVIKRLR